MCENNCVIFIHTAESISAAVVEALEPFFEEVTGNVKSDKQLASPFFVGEEKTSFFTALERG